MVYKQNEMGKEEDKAMQTLFMIYCNYKPTGILNLFVKDPAFYVTYGIGKEDEIKNLEDIKSLERKGEKNKIILKIRNPINQKISIDEIDKYLIELKNEIGDKKITIWKLWKYEKKVRNDAKRILGEFDE
jgi:hypothetical protein